MHSVNDSLECQIALKFTFEFTENSLVKKFQRVSITVKGATIPFVVVTRSRYKTDWHCFGDNSDIGTAIIATDEFQKFVADIPDLPE